MREFPATAPPAIREELTKFFTKYIAECENVLIENIEVRVDDSSVDKAIRTVAERQLADGGRVQQVELKEVPDIGQFVQHNKVEPAYDMYGGERGIQRREAELQDIVGGGDHEVVREHGRGRGGVPERVREGDLLKPA